VAKDGQPRKSKSQPVLDVGFTAAQARGVHGESDRLEPSPLGPSHQLLHHLPVLVHLQLLMAHMRKKKNQATKALFSSQKILQNFSDSSSHRIFRHMHGVLNIDENKN